MNRRTLILVLVLAGFAPAPALAEPAKAPRAAPAAEVGAPEPPRYQTRTRYDFEDDLVEGEIFTPDGTVVHAARHATFESMIRPREHFLPEMIKAADDL